MLSFAIIVFREVFEVALIVGILSAATQGLINRSKWVWAGIGLGLIGSGIVAYFAQTISRALEGMGQEMLNASILLFAALLIGWTVVWMHGHGRTLTQQLKEVGRTVTLGEVPLYTLAIVVALSVLRDGSELVLFTFGILASGENIFALTIGSVLGLASGIAIGVALYYGLIKISTRKLFSVTNWLLTLLAAGMVSQAVGFLTAAGFLPEIIYPLWDTSRIIAQSSWLGQVLHTLVGYCERPSGIQLISYLLTLGGISLILRFYGNLALIDRGIKKVLILLIVGGSIVLFGFPEEAFATLKVYSPIVEGGEFEIEARGSYDFDDRVSKDGNQKQKYSVGYGVTDRWWTELYGEVEKGRNDDGEDPNFSFTSMEWENRYQLLEQGKYWLDAGLYFAYEIPFENKHPGQIEGKLLLEKSLDKFTHTANVIFEKQVGGGAAEETVAGLAWSSRYRWHEYLEPGFEIHSDFGKLKEHTPYNEQQHQVGPVLYGKLTKELRCDIGYLFGVTDASPDGTLKWIFEYGMHF